MSLITLITDFGTSDYYVGAMKGIILQIAPDVRLVDITHHIQPHNVVHGAVVLRQMMACYPPGTVHVAVVDPGVGSERRIVAGCYEGQYVIAPDNGLISLVHRDMRLEGMHTVRNTRYFRTPVSHTFHGRDIIAPVAAHVASGVSIADLGPPADQLELLQFATPKRIEPAGLAGCVLYTDHFGNLATNISVADLGSLYRANGSVNVFVGEQCVGPIRRTYSDVPVGEPLALIGSSNMLEISVNSRRADEHFEHHPGTPVFVRKGTATR